MPMVTVSISPLQVPASAMLSIKADMHRAAKSCARHCAGDAARKLGEYRSEVLADESAAPSGRQMRWRRRSMFAADEIDRQRDRRSPLRAS